MLPNSLLLLLCLLPISTSQTFLQLLPEKTSDNRRVGDEPALAYCESWRLSVETGNAGHWKKIPSRCHEAIETYINGPQYVLDSKVTAHYANSYAKSIKIAGDKKDAWIFDVDETLISNLQHYTAKGYAYCPNSVLLYYAYCGPLTLLTKSETCSDQRWTTRPHSINGSTWGKHRHCHGACGSTGSCWGWGFSWCC